MNSQWKLVPIEPTQSILDAMTTERKKGNGVLQMWFEAMAAAPAPPEAHEAACDHEWNDDGGFLLVCTKCGTQENHDPKWRDMESAPKDGTLVRLLVSFDEHSTEDADEAPTIGANNFDNDGEDVWRFAGWCWSHDHFTQGVGQPVGWLPMIEASASTTELDRLTAERDALQQRLNEADQRIDELTAHRLVEPAAYQKPIDYWEGYGYIDRSCHIELRKMVDHLENLLDAIPEGPLYRRSPEQSEPFPGYPPVPDDRKLNPAKPQ